MSYLKKIKSFFIQILLLLTILWWYICFAFLFLFGAGFFLFRATLIDPDFGTSWILDERSSYCFKRNPNYLKEKTVSYFHNKRAAIFDDYGRKIGEYETGECDYGSYKSVDRSITKGTSAWGILGFMIIYPFCRIGALLASFIALFTNRFYVQVKAPEDYRDAKYNRFLHAYFNVVWEKYYK